VVEKYFRIEGIQRRLLSILRPNLKLPTTTNPLIPAMAGGRYSTLREAGPDTSEIALVQTGAKDGEHTRTLAIGPYQDKNARPAGLRDLWSSIPDVCLIIAAFLFLG
jgi:hypothetical protein